MKFTIFTFVFSISLYEPALVVNADRMVRFLFNNGTADPTSGECNADDNILLDAIFTNSGLNSTYGKRNLRQAKVSRKLPIYPPKCKNNCAGVTPGYCRATNCVGYRRKLGETAFDERDLSILAVPCETQVDYIHTELNKLVNNRLVSSGCQTLLQKPRNVKCYDDVVYGSVDKFRLWHTAVNPQVLLYDDFTGQSFCRGISVNFEVITNDCVDFLNSTIVGPNGYTESLNEDERPFAVFGDWITSFQGKKLPYAGNYTLTALPDGIESKKKVVKFNVYNGAIEKFRLWKTAVNPQVVLFDNYTGQSFCRDMSINFEVITNNCMIPYLNSTIVGPNGYTESFNENEKPFAVFGDWRTTFKGKKLPYAGNYTLTVVPGGLLEETKVVKFNVLAC